MLNAKELREQSSEELDLLLHDTKKELFALRNELRETKKLEQPHLITEKRRQIARILTVLCEKGTTAVQEA